MRTMNRLLPVVLGFALMVPGLAAAQTRKVADRCIADGSSDLFFVFQETPTTLSLSRVVPIRGFFRTLNDPVGIFPLYGSAVLEPTAGTVRMGFVVHARNSFTAWGLGSDSTFGGLIGFDIDGNNQADYWIDFYPVDCATVPIP